MFSNKFQLKDLEDDDDFLKNETLESCEALNEKLFNDEQEKKENKKYGFKSQFQFYIFVFDNWRHIRKSGITPKSIEAYNSYLSNFRS